VRPVSRAIVALVFVGGLLVGAVTDRSLFAEHRAAPAASTGPGTPVVAACPRDLAACTGRAQWLAQRMADMQETPGTCPPCAPLPSMPGMTPDEEAAAERGESPVCKPLLLACQEGRNKLRTQLARCVKGEPPEPEFAPPPVLTPQEEHDALFRSYDTAILVRRIDGTTRIYPPGEWPPSGGVGEGNYILAVAMPSDGGRIVWRWTRAGLAGP
jgi:hypothetical protein